MAWVADSMLRQQGCVRIDSMISDFDFRFLSNTLGNPYYLIAVIHTGGDTTMPDVHVMRCFLQPGQEGSQHDLVWLESGENKRLRFVKDRGSNPIRGIPDNPVHTFLRAQGKENYSCFLGYYLTTDNMHLSSTEGAQAEFLND